jgi:hypothetical protein
MLAKIGKKLKDIHTYYMGTRRVGHTMAILDGAKSNKDILVLVANTTQKKNINLPENQMVSINNLEALRGRRNPLLIDHFALQSMVSELFRDLDALSMETNKKILDYQLKISLFNERIEFLENQIKNSFINRLKRFLHLK